MSRKKSKQKRNDGIVHIGGIIGILNKHVTASLCGAAFKKIRTTEREREWSLYSLIRFWLTIVLVAPPSLAKALAECRAGRSGLLPEVMATAESFYQRCRDLNPDFFAELYMRFINAILPETPIAYASSFLALRERFDNIWVIDGSRLAVGKGCAST
jgi:hypothetical protein